MVAAGGTLARRTLQMGRVHASGASVGLREIARAWCICNPRTSRPMSIVADWRSLPAIVRRTTPGPSATRRTPRSLRSTWAAGTSQFWTDVVVEDGGKLVNAMIVDGQVCGARRKALGQCLLEAMPFDAHGQPLASSLLDYFLPGATEVPPIRVLHMETPSPHTEFGVKGIGEGGAVGPPAEFSAPSMTPCAGWRGVHGRPLTPVRIMQAISGGSASRSTRS